MLVNSEGSVVSGSGPNTGSDFGRDLLSCAVRGTPADEHPIRHVEDIPPRRGASLPWPAWAEPDVVAAFTARGVHTPWSHQVAAAELARAR